MIFAIFQGYLEFFTVFQNVSIFITRFQVAPLTMFRRTLVGKHFPRRCTTKGQLVSHTDYSSTANCRVRIPATFQGIFGIFRGISKCLRIYSTISRVTVVGKRLVMSDTQTTVNHSGFYFLSFFLSLNNECKINT